MKTEFKLFSRIRNACKTNISRPVVKSVNSVLSQAEEVDADEITETLGSVFLQNRIRGEKPVKIQPLKEIIYIHTDEVI